MGQRNLSELAAVGKYPDRGGIVDWRCCVRAVDPVT